MTDVEKASAINLWQAKWDAFIDEMLDRYKLTIITVTFPEVFSLQYFFLPHRARSYLFITV